MTTDIKRTFKVLYVCDNDPVCFERLIANARVHEIIKVSERNVDHSFHLSGGKHRTCILLPRRVTDESDVFLLSGNPFYYLVINFNWKREHEVTWKN